MIRFCRAAAVIMNIAPESHHALSPGPRLSPQGLPVRDYYHAELSAGRGVREAVIGFFRQPDNSKWTADAELLLNELARSRN